MDTIAAFRSRSEALKIYSLLKKNGIACSTINTPSSLKIGCGISIVFPGTLKDKVSYLVKKGRVTSFVGFFEK